MRKRSGRILCVLAMLFVMGMTVCAADAEDIKKNMVLQTNSDVELHEEPDATSGITATLPGGTPVIVKEDEKDGWCMVAYREDTGYVEVSLLGVLGSQGTPGASDDQAVAENETAVDEGSKSDSEKEATPETANALDEEFKVIKEEGQLAYQEAEAAKEQAASERTWGIVIAVLVIAIFAVGIITTLRNNKGKKKEQ